MAVPKLANVTTVSTKGQVILPKEVRDARRWPAGTKLEVVETPEGVLLKRAEPLFAPTRHEDVFGCLAPFYDGPPISVEEMDRGIEEAVRRDYARGRY